jgi:D-alanyl-D-alanine carboxypeptidase
MDGRDDLATYVKALVGGGLLEPEMQKRRLDSIQSTNPSDPTAAGYGLGIAKFGTALIGHDGQIPGYMTVMAYDPNTDLTVIIATNLAAAPSGEGSALVLLKAVVADFYGAAAVPGGDPAALPGATAVPPTAGSG